MVHTDNAAYKPAYRVARKKGTKDTKPTYYYYAWKGRGAPRIYSEPGTVEFVRELSAALENHRTGDKKKIDGLVIAYRASDAYIDLASGIRRNHIAKRSCVRRAGGFCTSCNHRCISQVSRLLCPPLTTQRTAVEPAGQKRVVRSGDMDRRQVPMTGGGGDGRGTKWIDRRGVRGCLMALAGLRLAPPGAPRLVGLRSAHAPVQPSRFRPTQPRRPAARGSACASAVAPGLSPTWDWVCRRDDGDDVPDVTCGSTAGPIRSHGCAEATTSTTSPASKLQAPIPCGGRSMSFLMSSYFPCRSGPNTP